MTIKSIEVEYEDGARLALTSSQLASEFVRFVGSLRTDSAIAAHDTAIVRWGMICGWSKRIKSS